MKDHSEWISSLDVRAFQDQGISKSIIRKKTIHKKSSFSYIIFHSAILWLYSNFLISFLGSLKQTSWSSIQLANIEF